MHISTETSDNLPFYVARVTIKTSTQTYQTIGSVLGGMLVYTDENGRMKVEGNVNPGDDVRVEILSCVVY